MTFSQLQSVRLLWNAHVKWKHSQHSSIIWLVWLSVRLWTKWLWVRVQLQSLVTVCFRKFVCYLKKRQQTAKQLCVGSPGTQMLYFWWSILLEKCQKAQILCISLFSCYKTYDIIFLPDVDGIHKILWFCSNFKSPGIQTKLVKIQSTFW